MEAAGARPEGSPLVEVHGLTCGHRLGRPDEVIALWDVELELMPGERLALVGFGGSGKTTLLRVLAGLDEPAAGRVLVGGLDLARSTASERDRYRRRLVGYVAQQPGSGLWPSLTAAENVLAPMLVAGVRREERRERAGELLAALRLDGRPQLRPAQLAGGEKLRLALAVALANRPALLLVDEPAGELDAGTARAVLHDLEAPLRRLGVAAVIASRSQGLAEHVDRVAWLSGSRMPALVSGAHRGA
jgi:putative ABC transport system ATP-binding protein